MKRKTTFLTKALTLLFVMLLSLTGARAQQDLTVCNGTATNQYIPVYAYSGDTDGTTSEFVIPADELTEMASGTISQMTFYLSQSASKTWTAVYQVYLAEVSENTLSSTVGPNACTVVYTGTVDGSGSTMVITFDDSYTYSGGNLLVGTYVQTSGTWDSSGSFYGVEVTGAAYLSGDWGGYNSGVKNFIPKTTFTYIPASGVIYYKPKDLTMGEITATTAAISWTAPSGDVTSYKYQYKKTSDGDEAWSTEQTVTSPSVNLSNLDAGTSYNFRVKAVYADNGESGYASIGFTTQYGIQSLPYYEGFEDGIGAWQLVNCHANTGINQSAKYEGSYGFDFRYSTTPPQYLISPEFDGTTAISVSFWFKNSSSTYPETFQVGYSTTTKDVSAFTWGEEIEKSNQEWEKYEDVVPVGTKYVAVRCNSNDKLHLYLDSFSFEAFNGLLKPTDLAATEISTTGATLNWTANNDSYVLQYRTAAKDMNLDAWHQVGDDKAATGTMTTYTYDLSEYSGTGFIAIRHYDVSDMFRLIVDDIVVTNAGGSVVFEENFETSGGTMPASISTFDLDGDGYEWGVVDNSQSSVNGDYGLSSASWTSNTGALTPDNWLILSNVELGGTLTFAARGQDANFPAENFGVFVTNESGTFDAVPAGEWSNEIATAASPYALTGLTPNTSYEWRVKGITGGEETNWATSTFSTIRDNFKTFVTAGDWNVAENWYPVGVPALTDEVSITKAATIPAGVVAVAKKVSLDGGSVTIKDGGELKQGSAALQIAMEKEITGFGTGTGKYALISAPFSGKTQLYDNDSWYSVNITSDSEFELYGFDPTQTNEWVNFASSSSHSLFDDGNNGTCLAFDNGYLYAMSDDKTLNFTGNTWSSLNNTVTVDYTYNATSEDSFNGWRLIGNPFTCTGYITYSEDATFYKMNAAGTGFVAYENAIALAPGEGAFMKVAASGTITYSSEPLAVEPVSAGAFYNIVLPAHGETTDQDANTTVVQFADNGDNTALIESLNGQTVDVQLTGRRLYKDGSWNTICLPFDFRLDETVLAGADLRPMAAAQYNNGTLTISFESEGVSKYAVGTPCIIKWDKPTGYESDPDAYDIIDPVFSGVNVQNIMQTNFEYELGDGMKVSFRGTYGYTSFTDVDKSILFMGAANKLYYPGAGAEIGAFRAYFELEGLTAGQPVSAGGSGNGGKFIMRFNGDDATGINNLDADADETIYNLAGQRINKAQKGVNIVNGKKVAIK
jgi:hypothetical protein